MLSKFDYFKPQNLEEAIAYLKENPGTRILAGGTDLMILLRRNIEIVDHILDIKSISETKRMEYTPGEGLFIGASITVNQVAESEIIREKYEALAQAADSLASYQLRNRATLVGNICNASPGADLSGPLLIFNSKVHIAGPNGNRTVEIDKFFTGVKRTVLQPDEIVVGVSIPDVEEGDKSIYLKQARIKGHDLGIAGVAIRITASKEVFIGMSAVAPTPIRLTKLEEMIASKELTPELANWVEEELRNHIRPISDVRSSAEYRLHVSGVLAKKGLTQLLEKGVN
ncbi:carbon-monoxide dehydrogenase medium subunit [Proteiniborus ethanoligenes]|uniref:Carbon-monoxide dehydrogenase medium subunit n=1 Tax=Proteiniborus ethanoligenes TaxID=415015 RepID=A0A1H3RC34_9FIRM|nr:xanthine dehydrogenase family protein subunit M [Proteiniborus ethanoligenes]SDZ22885.1 carbon-monoxide dehydrogenase medium subunit [Proteiniborus ethanoligenes]